MPASPAVRPRRSPVPPPRVPLSLLREAPPARPSGPVRTLPKPRPSATAGSRAVLLWLLLPFALVILWQLLAGPGLR